MSEKPEVSLRATASIRALLARLGPLPADYDKVHFDSALPGYGLRARGSGVHSLMVQYAIAGRTRRIVVGKFGNVDLGKAYSTARDLLAQARLGHDPAAEKELAKVRAGETFGALLPRFLERQRQRQKPRSYTSPTAHTFSVRTSSGAAPQAITPTASSASASSSAPRLQPSTSSQATILLQEAPCPRASCTRASIPT